MTLSLQSIQKSFGPTRALRDGTLEARCGEVHLLLGENGAGKSTLMKIAAGMMEPDAGTIGWQGRTVRFRSPAEAQRAGISMVHQESLLAPHLTVAENVFMGREPSARFGFLPARAGLAETRRIIEEHRFPLRAESLVSTLSPAGRQMVEICRALAANAALIIFDEPTSALSGPESAEVLRIVGGLRDRGAAVVYITHRMDELRWLGGQATVLRDGRTVFTGPLAESSTETLIHHMAGRAVDAAFERRRRPAGPALLEASLPGIELSLPAGQITGLAGLVGAGRTELCETLFGLRASAAGAIRIEGRAVRIGSPRDAIKAGIALVPEDRQRHGLAAELTVGHNMTLASLAGVSPFGVLRAARERALVTATMAAFHLKTPSAGTPASRLSGGNQQKLVIAKWRLSGARIFLFDEPTRGIDIAAKQEVFRQMDALAEEGAAVLMVSSELPELLQLCDRILVVRGGRLAATLGPETTQEEILRHAALDRAS